MNENPVRKRGAEGRAETPGLLPFMGETSIDLPRKKYSHGPKIRIGDEFHRLTVVANPYTQIVGDRKRRMVPCRCSCGQEKEILHSNLRGGVTKSCGCYKIEVMERTHTKHGHNRRGKRTQLYNCFHHIRERCGNPNSADYPDYGGRGIRVCPEWAADFQTFANWATSNGFREGLSIDRIDVNGNYEPGNCRWTDEKKQARNRRSSVIVEAFAESKCVAEWVEDARCSVDALTIYNRLDYGWHPEDAVATPKWGRARRAHQARAVIADKSSVLSEEELAVETWKPIPDFPGYAASDMGRIMGKSGAILTIQYPDSQRYGHGKIVINDSTGRPRSRFIAPLVLAAHRCERPEGMVACHFPDPNPRNCRLSNLRWDTRSENSRDRTRTTRLMVEYIADARVNSEIPTKTE